MAKIKVRKMDTNGENQLKFGLFIKSSLIGFMLAAPATSGALQINDINLQPNYKGLGYDELLLETASHEASASGLKGISLEIHPHEFSSYQHLGFEKDGDKYSRDGHEWVRILKSI